MPKTDPIPYDFSLPDPRLKFLSTEFENFTYGDLYHVTRYLDERLRAFKPDSERPLLIISDNTPVTVFTVAACFLLKIPILPIHKKSTEMELEAIVSALTPCAVISSNVSQATLNPSFPSINIPQEVLKTKESYQSEPFLFDEQETIAGYFQTSGSTGSPKIVPLMRRQIFSGAVSSAKNFQPGMNKYWLLCLPLHHVGGVNVIYRSLLYHSAIFLVPSFDPGIIRTLIHENEDFEAASMVPTMLHRLLDHTFFRVQFGFKALLLGGGPIPISLINKALTRGLPIVTSYGMTETCAQIAANPMLRPSGEYIPKKSVGPVFEPNKIEIRDDHKRPLPFNESGQIWLKGPQIFDGYLDQKQNSTSFDKNGWFNTGDYGHLNRKKQLFIENRRSDLIITGGENVNPLEVEESINRIQGVKESAVIGIPDERWGQMVVAFLVLADNELRRNDIKKILKQTLQSFKIPKQFISVNYLPKTDNEKVKKSELLNWYQKQFAP